MRKRVPWVPFYRNLNARHNVGKYVRPIMPPEIGQTIEVMALMQYGEPAESMRHWATVCEVHQLVVKKIWPKDCIHIYLLTGGWYLLTGPEAQWAVDGRSELFEMAWAMIDRWLEENPMMNVYSKAASLGYSFIRGDGRELNGIWFTRFTKTASSNSEAIFVGYNHKTRKFVVGSDSYGAVQLSQ
jgi:hypothetical protein